MSAGKSIAIIGAIGLIGLGIWMAAPLFYDKEVNEALPQSSGGKAAPQPDQSDSPVLQPTSPAVQQVVTLSQGQFEGFDRLHNAAGTAQIVEVSGQKYVRFSEDFNVTNGPDLFVHLGKDGKYAAQANLGKLKGNVGSQNYLIPDSINIDDYNEVWVWCRAFAVPFGKAELN